MSEEAEGFTAVFFARAACLMASMAFRACACLLAGGAADCTLAASSEMPAQEARGLQAASKEKQMDSWFPRQSRRNQLSCRQIERGAWQAADLVLTDRGGSN